MTIKEEMMPKKKNEMIEVKKVKKAVIQKNKPTKIEKELKQVRSCLKDKDKRIESLEVANKMAVKNKTYLIDTFNFLSLFFFTISVVVLLVVCNLFHHQWFMDAAPTFALWGSICIGGNLFIGMCGIIYEKPDDPNGIDADLVMCYVIFNCMVIPVIMIVHTVVIGMLLVKGS